MAENEMSGRSTSRARGHRVRITAVVLGIFLVGGGIFALNGCASQTDPKKTRDSFVEMKRQVSAEESEKPDAAAPDAAPAPNEDATDLPLPEVEERACKPYLVVTARGTGEPVKGQLLGGVAKAISNARPKNMIRVDLDYPADTEVKDGASLGVRTLLATLNTQAELCPDQSFVLLGYSQGAMVIGDTLSAPEGRLVGETSATLTEEAAKRILAVVLYGDPRFVGSAEYNVGSFDPKIDGVLPRAAGSLDDYADRLRDYCVEKDIVCQGRLELDEKGHVAYFKNGMRTDGAAFAITKLLPIDEPDAEDEDSGSANSSEEQAPTE